MRKMKRNGSDSVVTVHGWAVTRNGWEYYFLEKPKGDIVFALVMGFENEMGDVSLSEISPHITSAAKGAELLDLGPAEGWEWMD